MKVYVVKEPQGEYEEYEELVVKVFLNKTNAENFVREENSKRPLEQARKCSHCVFMWENDCSRGREKPECFKDDGFKNCMGYLKYHNISALFLDEYDIEDFADYTKQVRKEVCDEIKEVLCMTKENTCPNTENVVYYDVLKNILNQIQGE